MPVELALVLRALKKHKVVAAIIALQIALATMIVGNGVNVLMQRGAIQRLESGMAEDALLVLAAQTMSMSEENPALDTIVQQLSTQAGVKSVSYVSELPFSSRASEHVFSANPAAGEGARLRGHVYMAGPLALKTLGVQLLSGRDFSSEDYPSAAHDAGQQAQTVILGQALARQLGVTVGDTVDMDGRMLRVVGMVADVMPPVLQGADDMGRVALVPMRSLSPLWVNIIVNAEPQMRESLVATSLEIAARHTSRSTSWQAQTFTDMRQQYFRMDRIVVRLAIVLALIISTVVAIGIGGLSAYWIDQRRKSVGIRRMLGATRRQVAAYFHVENLLVSLPGCLLGAAGAWYLSHMLSHWLEMPPLSWPALLAAMLLMLLLGQWALWLPLRRQIRV